MTNGEKFKTAEERKVAYFLYCGDFTENMDNTPCDDRQTEGDAE